MTENNNDIVLVGGGGHCKAVIDVIEQEGKYRIVGIVDVKEKVGNQILGYEIFAVDDDLERLARKYKYFLVTVGQIGTAEARTRIYERLGRLGISLPVIASPTSIIAKSAKIGAGTVIMHHSLVSVDTKIGANCIINNHALIEHDARVGDHTHISTRVTVNGGCKIGNACFIGSGATIFQGVRVADEVVVGAGSLVTKDLTAKGVYFGVPAKKIR